MEQFIADMCVYPPLTAVTSLYAAALDYNQRKARHYKLEPDLTLLEVVVGCLICLGAAEVRSRLGPPDQATYRRAVWRSFIIGGTPIAIWQIWRIILRWRRRTGILQHYTTKEPHATEHRERPPATLASLGQQNPPAHRGNGWRLLPGRREGA